MRIDRISIRAFRSLYDVTFVPGHFTVLVGPNNAGKSNFAEAIDFLGEVHRLGLELAVIRKGGYENIAHRRMRRTKSGIAFQVDVNVRLREILQFRDFLKKERERGQLSLLGDTRKSRQDPVILVRHSFEIRATGQKIQSDYAVREEAVLLQLPDRDDDSTILEVVRENREIMLLSIDERFRDDAFWQRVLRPFELDRLMPLTEGLSQTELWLLTGGYLARYLARTLGNTRLYQLNPLECRRPGVMTPNPDLDRYGNNLPGLVAYMQRYHRKPWEATMQAMREIVPGLVDIRTAFTHDRRLTLQFVEQGVGRPWTSEEVSDGTIQSLALFAVLHDPRIPLVLVEEPENSVHPWIVRAFVDACRAATDKQIIITSHSPALIGYLKPDEVTVVWRKEGRTNLERLVDIEPEAHTMWANGELTPFDILDSGWIRQSVPEGYA